MTIDSKDDNKTTKTRATPRSGCKHLALVPLEIDYARKFNAGDWKKPDWQYDFATNIMGATVARVSKYYCPACKQEIIPGKD